MAINKDGKWILYVHINKSNGKKYVGITGREPEERWKSNGDGYVIGREGRFPTAIKKYGWNNFYHIILEDNLTYEEACKLEIECISKWKLQDKLYGYNMSPGGTGGNQKPTTPVSAFDLNGSYLASFDSAAECARNYGLYRGQVTHVCNGDYKTCKGLIFRYKGDNDELGIEVNLHRKSTTNIIVNQYDKNMKLLNTYYSIKEASDKSNIAYGYFADYKTAVVWKSGIRFIDGYYYEIKKVDNVA